MELAEIVEKIKVLLKQPNPSASDWADLMTYLQILLHDATNNALQKEVLAMRKFKELRHAQGIKTRADAEIEWKASDEWYAWREAEEQKEEIEKWKTVASRQASTRNKNY